MTPSTWKEILSRSAGWAPDTLAEILLQTKDASPSERFFIVTCAHDEISAPIPDVDELVSFGKAFDLDEYSTRQRLSLPAPRIWKASTSKSKATDWVEWMEKLGVPAFMLEESRLNHLRFRTGIVISLDEEGMRAQLDHKKVSIAWQDVGLLVSGKLRFERRTSENDRKPVSSPRAIALETGPDLSPTFELGFLDIHLIGKRDVLRIIDPEMEKIEIVRNSRPYPMKGREETLIKMIKAFHPIVSIYDSFEAARGAYGDSMKTVDIRYSVAKPASLQGSMLSASAKSVRTEEKNPLPLFDLYSVLCRYQYRRAPR